MCRDVFMADSVAEALSSRSSATAGSSPSTLIAVVGMMHLDGIQRTLMTRYGYTLVNTPACPAETSATSRSGTRGSNNSWRQYGTYDLPIIS